MSTSFHRSATEFSRRTAAQQRKFSNPERYLKQTEKDYVKSATAAIASTAQHQHALQLATNRIKEIKEAKRRAKEQQQQADENSHNLMTEEMKKQNMINQKILLQEASRAASSIISTARQNEIINFAKNKKMDELVTALDNLVKERFTFVRNNNKNKKKIVFIPDSFCQLVVDCSKALSSKNEDKDDTSSQKLFERYRSLMSVDQQLRFDFDDIHLQQHSSPLEEYIDKNFSEQQKLKYAPLLMKRLCRRRQTQQTKHDNDNITSSDEWQTALQSLSCVISSPEFLTPSLSSIVLKHSSSSSSSSDSKSSSISNVRKTLDILCESKPSLVSEISLWNEYLRGILVAIVNSSKTSENTTDEDENYAEHSMNLVEVNMPEYKVKPTSKTIELVIKIINAYYDEVSYGYGKQQETARSFMRRLVNSGAVEEKMLSMMMLKGEEENDNKNAEKKEKKEESNSGENDTNGEDDFML